MYIAIINTTTIDKLISVEERSLIKIGLINLMKMLILNVGNLNIKLHLMELILENTAYYNLFSHGNTTYDSMSLLRPYYVIDHIISKIQYSICN